MCHRASPMPEVAAVDVELSLIGDGAARLTFSVETDLSQLRIPQSCAADAEVATDGLWRHTCGELFVATANQTAYREFNFSPSGAWAWYAFSDYRVLQDGASSRLVPQIASKQSADGLVLQIMLPRGSLPDANVPATNGLDLSPTMVIEAADGRLSYWAVTHPFAHPDFHHRSGFIRDTDTSAFSRESA